MLIKNRLWVMLVLVGTVMGASCMRAHMCVCSYVENGDTTRRAEPIYGSGKIAKEDCLKREKDTVHTNFDCEYQQ